MENQKVSRDVKDFFHHYAGGFDAIYGHTDNRNAFEKWIDKNFRKTMFLRFKEALQESSKPEIKTIIDIGCGPGRYVVDFLNQGKEVLGVDLAQGMLDIAGKLATESKNKNVQFLLGDYAELSLSKKYDAACLMGFFDYIEKPSIIIQKLKKDINKEFYASFPQSGGFLAWQRSIRYKWKNCPLYLYSKEDVEKLMKDNGITNYVIKDFGRDYYVKAVLS